MGWSQAPILLVSMVIWPLGQTTITSTKWTKVFSHDTAGGLFSSDEDALLKNPDDSEAKLFSILSRLETFRLEDGSFHLRLCYPGLTNSSIPCNEWTQTSNPATQCTITGFQPIHITFNSSGARQAFGGLGISDTTQTLIDDTGEGGSWWGAIGAMSYHEGDGNIPGPIDQVVRRVELHAVKPVVQGNSRAEGQLKPVAASMSSESSRSPASSCIDGRTTHCTAKGYHDGPGASMCHTGTHEDNAPWLAIELEGLASVHSVTIYNRGDCCGSRFRNAEVRLTNQLPNSSNTMFQGGELLGSFPGPGSDGQVINITGPPRTGRFVLIQMNNRDNLNLYEVQVFGTLLSQGDYST